MKYFLLVIIGVIFLLSVLVWNLFEDKIIDYFEDKWRKRKKKDPK